MLLLRAALGCRSKKHGLGLLHRFSTSPSNCGTPSWLRPEAAVASPDFKQRWLMFAPAFATHLCLGAPYGWSAISATLTRECGFVVSSASDWSLSQMTVPMSLGIAVGGLAGAFLGAWRMRVGTRAAMLAGAGLVGSGFALASAGVAMHSLAVVYSGMGVCGLGIGCAYIPPIQALVEWFPDRKGLASGLTLAGFGSGALLFAPVANWITQAMATAPKYLGSGLSTVEQGGRLFASVDGVTHEVVVATAAELSKLPSGMGLKEGLYVVGSGDTGVSAFLLSIGVAYAAIIAASAMTIRRPLPGYLPEGMTLSAHQNSPLVSLPGNVTVPSAMRTSQFWLLFGTSCCIASGGMGLMSVAKPMVSDVFATAMPAVVTAAFASNFLMAMAVGNLMGRLVWSAFSDRFGRRSAFLIFTLAGIPLYAGMPLLIGAVMDNVSGGSAGATAYLAAFCGSSVAAVTLMGGNFGTLIAYEADLFGTKYLDAIHGRMLLSATVATIAGPTILLKTRSDAEAAAIADLMAKVDPSTFKTAFGADPSTAQALIEAKTVTIPKLLTLLPPGTLDPSPFLYNNALYAMAALAVAASAMHWMVRPVDPKVFEAPPKADSTKVRDA